VHRLVQRCRVDCTGVIICGCCRWRRFFFLVFFLLTRVFGGDVWVSWLAGRCLARQATFAGARRAADGQAFTFSENKPSTVRSRSFHGSMVPGLASGRGMEFTQAYEGNSPRGGARCALNVFVFWAAACRASPPPAPQFHSLCSGLPGRCCCDLRLQEG